MIARFTRFAGIIAVVLAAALVFPVTAGADTVWYVGETSPQDFTNDQLDNGKPQTFKLELDGANVVYVNAFTSLRCPDGRFVNIGAPSSTPGLPFPVIDGHFDATIGDPNDGFGYTWHLVGDIVNAQASGTAEVQGHEFSGVAPSGPICTSSFTWTASIPGAPVSSPPATDPWPDLPSPVKHELTPPHTPDRAGPAARLLVVALRSASGRFYWGTALARCHNGATHLVFTVRRNRELVSRRRLRCRKKILMASSAIEPNRTYSIRVQAIRMRRGRVVARGEKYGARLYMPGNEAAWIPVPGLRLP